MSRSTHEPFPPSQSKIILAGNANSHSAAFLGASHAFSQPIVPPKPLQNNYSGYNGAVAAAAFAGKGEQRPAKSADQVKALFHKTESHVTRLPAIQSHKQLSEDIEKEDLRQGARIRGQSPSHIAALLAASNSSTNSNANMLPNQKSSRLSAPQNTPRHYFSNDESPLLATNALVKLFESHTGIVTPSAKAGISPMPKHLLQSMSPSLTAPLEGMQLGNLAASMHAAESPIDEKKTLRPPSKEALASTLPSPGITAAARVTLSSLTEPGKPEIILRSKRTAPTPPPPRRTRQNRDLGQPNECVSPSFTNHPDGNSSPSSYVSAVDAFEPASATVRLCPARKSSMNRIPRASNENMRSVSANTSSRTVRHSEKAEYLASIKPGRDGPLLPNSLTPQLTADSLADAMVASSLASSRAPSPSKLAPPLPRRQSKPHNLFRLSQSQDQDTSRTPSPYRGMRHTLREPSKLEDDDDFKKRNGHLLKKYPNKHHEGDRKRWRDQITEHERKRYEGVWAANKGLCMPPGDSDLVAKVLNLVVRDIWRRSQLPDHVLEEVWDLVDSQGLGRLDKEEFVVGLWLIDQRLKGRKLPVKVSESVWSSARRLSGIKVPKSHR